MTTCRVEYNGQPLANFQPFTNDDQTNSCWISQYVRAFNPLIHTHAWATAIIITMWIKQWTEGNQISNGGYHHEYWYHVMNSTTIMPSLVRTWWHCMIWWKRSISPTSSTAAKKQKISYSTFQQCKRNFYWDHRILSWIEYEIQVEEDFCVVPLLKCSICKKFRSRIISRRNFNGWWIHGAESICTSNIRDHHVIYIYT